MADFCMPSLGADMESGTLVEWRTEVGQHVGRDEIIAEVETDKGLIEIEAFIDGVVEELIVEPGSTVDVGTVLARIRPDGAAPDGPTVEAPSPATQKPVTSPADTPPSERSAAEPAPAQREAIRASPAARRRARELGVPLEEVDGTASGGAIRVADVERAGLARRGDEPEGQEAALDRPARMRRAIASAMERSKREIPHYYVATQIDMGRALDWMRKANEERSVGDRLLPVALQIKAVALALRAVPELNGYWRDGRVVPSSSVHVGVAISLREGGLMAPAIRDADELDLGSLDRALKDLVRRARKGGLRGSELAAPTVTVTSLGDRGAEIVYGVIHPPQVAIVGFGRICDRPWCAGDRIVPRPIVHVSLAADHRATDGQDGARFLDALDARLQAPEEL